MPLDWLERWFTEPDFRGCAWINAFGELGSASPAVLAAVREHKEAFHQEMVAWVEAVEDVPAEPLCLLAEGAIVTAAITETRAPPEPPTERPRPSSGFAGSDPQPSLTEFTGPA